MQPQSQDEQQTWQQPPQAPAAAPYQAPSTETIAPPAPSEVEAQPPDDTVVEPVDMSVADEDASNPEAMQVDDADEVNEDDASVLRWQAAEYVQQEQSRPWFIGLGVVVVALMAIAFFLMKSITFMVLIPIMAVALVVYVKRPAVIHDYTLSRKGLHVDDKLFPYDQFKSFGVLSKDDKHAIVFTPRRRFQIGHTIYFPEEVGESLVDMLATRLPMKEVKPDMIDNLLARLRL